MAITVEIPGGERVQIEEKQASIGRDPACRIALPDATQLESRHASLRCVANRWMIESDGDWLIQAGNGSPNRMSWLEAGDIIRLTESGPELYFEPAGEPASEVLRAPPHQMPAPQKPAPTVTSTPNEREFTDVTSEVGRERPPGNGGLKVGDPQDNSTSGPIRPLANHPLLYVVVTAVVAIAIFIVAKNEPPQNSPADIQESNLATEEAGTATEKSSTTKRGPTGVNATGELFEEPDEVAISANSEGIVWIGFRKSDFVFTYATGWLLRPDHVVTTAAVVSHLKPLLDDGVDVVVHFNGRVIEANDLKIHSKYDQKNPGSPESIAHNIGILALEQSLLNQCATASSKELKKLTIETTLIAVGYVNSGDELEPFDRLKVRMNRQIGKLVGSDQEISTGKAWYKTNIISPKGMDGAAVMTNSGKIIGLLAPYPNETVVVPIDTIRELLTQ